MRKEGLKLNSFNTLLHAEHTGHEGISGFLSKTLGVFGEFLDEVVIHSILETLTLIPFLFLAYLLMEFIEHKAQDKAKSVMEKAGKLGPLVGGALGVLPQCGFSAAAANLYTGRVISIGTLIAVFLSTSDEMLPILIAGNVDSVSLLSIIIYKAVVAVLVGFTVDIVFRLIHGRGDDVAIHDMCEDEGCHCEDGIFRSALKHTGSVTLSCFIIILALNALLFFVPTDAIAALIPDIPVLSHLICAIVGLIPNCAASVALSQLALKGVITVGEMLAGLFAGAGVGVLILFKMNKNIKENFTILGIVLILGALFGALADVLPFISI